MEAPLPTPNGTLTSKADSSTLSQPSASSPMPWDLVWLISVSALCLLSRGVFLLSSKFGIESDEAIVGLMAKHIAEDGVRPVFYYGQHYLGALEAYLVSIPFFFFEVSQFWLKLVPTLGAVLFVVCTYYFARQFSGVFGARVASLLAAFPPQALLVWSTKARGGFIELLVIGSLSLILTVIIWRNLNQKEKLPLIKIFILGLLIGLGWWVNNQIVFYAISSAILLGTNLLWRKGFGKSLASFFTGLFGFFLGGWPFWQANLLADKKFQSFEALFGGTREQVKNQPFVEMLSEQMTGFYEVSLPILAGSRRFWSDAELFPNSSLIALGLYGFSAFLALVSIVFSKRLGLPRAPVSLLFIFFFATSLIFSASSFGWLSHAPRYLLPLYSVSFVVLALAASSIKAICGSFVGVIFASAFLIFSFASNYLERPIKNLSETSLAVNIPGEPFVHKGERVSRDHSELLEYLKEENISHVHTNYWIGYRLAFETNEAVTFSRYGIPRTIRIPSYEVISRSEREQRVFVLVKGQGEALKRSLESRGILYSESQASGYTIIREEGGVSALGDPLGEAEVQIEVSAGEEFLEALQDNQLGSRWRSATPQTPGMSILARFKNDQQIVSGLSIDHGFWPHDGAQGLLIEGQNYDGSWCVLYEAVTVNERILKMHFEPQEFTALKLTQTGQHPLVDWSIAELDIFGRP